MATVSVRIEIILPESDAELVEFATVDLRQELLGLDVVSIEALGAEAPPVGAKVGNELVMAGTLLLAIPRSALLSAVVEIVKTWAGRATGRSARLEIDDDVLDMKGLSSRQQQQLIEDWIARHDVPES